MSNILYPDTELLKRWGMFLSEVDFPKKISSTDFRRVGDANE